jgi:hypothetical protein
VNPHPGNYHPALRVPQGSEPPVMQVLATEHWSLLATRSMTWNEIFSRTGTFLTVLSANTVALGLVVNANGFGDAFLTVSLTLLPIVVLVGLGTYVRLVEADIEDAWLVIGMNRIRHAYLELVPELEPYFVAGYHDDAPGLLQTYSFSRRIGPSHWLSGSPVVVGVVDAMLAGVLVSIACEAVGVAGWLRNLLGLIAGIGVAVLLAKAAVRRVGAVRASYRSRFPAAGDAEGIRP